MKYFQISRSLTLLYQIFQTGDDDLFFPDAYHNESQLDHLLLNVQVNVLLIRIHHQHPYKCHDNRVVLLLFRPGLIRRCALARYHQLSTSTCITDSFQGRRRQRHLDLPAFDHISSSPFIAPASNRGRFDFRCQFPLCAVSLRGHLFTSRPSPDLTSTTVT